MCNMKVNITGNIITCANPLCNGILQINKYKTSTNVISNILQISFTWWIILDTDIIIQQILDHYVTFQI